MTRLINRPMDPPDLDVQGQPAAFMWRGARYVVDKILDGYLETGRWWEQEPSRQYWRVLDRNLGEWTICRDSTGTWWMYRIFD